MLELKQAKLTALTFHYANTEILKENHALRKELNKVKSITNSWFNNSNRVSECINDQIPNKKLKTLGAAQLTESYSKKESSE